MAEYLSPGVYIEEIPSGPVPIEGVSTSTAGMVGQTRRGPTAPHLITSWLDFQRVYGGHLNPEASYLSYAVQGFFANGGKRTFISRVVAQGAQVARSSLDTQGDAKLEIEALGEGAWGNNVRIAVAKASREKPELFRLRVLYFTNAPGKSYDPSDRENYVEPDIVEEFDNLSPNPEHPDFVGKIVNAGSRLVRIVADKRYRDAPSRPKDSPLVDEASAIKLTGGLDHEGPKAGQGGKPPAAAKGGKGAKAAAGGDGGKGGDGGNGGGNGAGGGNSDGNDGGPVGLDRYTGDFPENLELPPEQQSGLLGLSHIREISLLVVPDMHAVPGLMDKVVTQCETLKSRFAVLHYGREPGPVQDLQTGLDTSYAARYYPWLRILDPRDSSGKETLPIPPSGHVAGIYARTDVDRGVHKAPANEPLRGILVQDIGPAKPLYPNVTVGQQDILNPRNINCIRDFRSEGRGVRVWGGRTMSSDGQWKYINVRRLFIFVEQSVENGTQWVVFEPNDEYTWQRVISSVSNFLMTLWRNGALFGSTPGEAFFVKCDRSTMTQDDIDNGRLICLVGIAPVKPAEFVIFRFSQKTIEAEG